MARTTTAKNDRWSGEPSAFVALADISQSAHASASMIHERLIQEHWRVFTSNFVLAETHALAMRRLGRYKAWELLQDLDESALDGDLRIARVEAGDELKAREIIKQYDDKDFSLVDASSFAVMERLHLPTAFSFDRHFEQFGFVVLKP